MKKRILSILLILCMVLGFVPLSVLAETYFDSSWTELTSVHGGTMLATGKYYLNSDITIDSAITITDKETGALPPEGNLSLVDDYHTSYSDGSGQQFITLVSKSGATFYLVIDRNAKGQQTVHFMNLVDEADLLTLMEEEDAEAYTAEKEAVAQAEL